MDIARTLAVEKPGRNKAQDVWVQWSKEEVQGNERKLTEGWLGCEGSPSLVVEMALAEAAEEMRAGQRACEELEELIKKAEETQHLALLLSLVD